jgi:formylglycine-generating enzyme required for sulfatase activity
MGCQSAACDRECFDVEKPPRTVRVSGFSIGKHKGIPRGGFLKNNKE